jgi:hypothetical protein
METKPKPLTPQKVTAVLKKAGFEKAESWPSRIRGLKNWSSGYRVQKSWSGAITVVHKSDDYVITEGRRARQAEQCEKYAVALEAAGLVVDRTDPMQIEVRYPAPAEATR